MSFLSRLFGRGAREEKASQVGPLLASYVLGRPMRPQRDFAQLAKEGYAGNSVVYACIWNTALAASTIPLEFMRKDAEVEVPDLRRLIDNPNPDPTCDGMVFRHALFSDFLLGGNAFVERVDIRRKPVELYRWRPDRTAVIPGQFGWPEGFRYTVNGHERTIQVDATKPDQMAVWQMKDYSPVDDWNGMSPLDPAAYSVDSHTGFSAWNKALLDNGARPSGALVYAPKDGPSSLGDEQFMRLKAELQDAYSGARNAGRPMLLDGGLTWQELSLSPKDGEFSEAKNAAAREIALALGVPPLVLGIPGDNTFANYAEANKAFYRQTVIPLVWRLCRGWSMWLAPAFGDGIRIVPDLDDLPAFADERAAYRGSIEKSNVLTVNEKRAMGWGLAPVSGGDVLLVPSTDIPLESAATPIDERTGGEDDSAEADDEADETLENEDE